jgi:DMSO/TMAO reductase YedYZ molybdopterin-dependent catalytic subunit
VRVSPRRTNLTLFLVLALTFATGVGVVATGSARGRWIAIAHGVVAMAVILLIPWKTRVIRRGLRRARRSRWASLTLAALVVTTLLAGFGYATGLVRSVAGVPGMWWHVAIALALAPLLIWHVSARPARPRRGDLSRRVVLRAGLLAVVAGGAYAATASTVALARLPGARRRFTGSYEQGSLDPSSMPNTIWLDDTVPTVDASSWRLAVGSARFGLSDLAALPQVTRRVTLDCTSGWYAHQDWTGVPLRALLPDVGDARSILVGSTTGYWIRLPVSDLDTTLLATAVGGAPLSPGHGFPLRLVVPGRRGYWWVKWVDRVDLSAAPWWWQPPFPVT